MRDIPGTDCGHSVGKTPWNSNIHNAAKDKDLKYVYLSAIRVK